jgi:hypothetical protein
MQEKGTPAAGREPVVTTPPFPVDRAFVVQLRAPADVGGEVIAGRVEHIASGAVARFASADGLIAFLTSVLSPGATAA